MSINGTDGLLSALVENIRQACQQHITFEDFVSITGLISFDVDGSKQQCFVINEFVQKKNVGEVCSTHLKTLDWKNINRDKSSACYTTFTKGIFSECTAGQHEKEEYGKICRQADQKDRSGPLDTFANINSKLDWSNRTFTLKKNKAAPQSGAPSSSPKKNISSSTITVPNEASDKENHTKSRQIAKRNVCQGSLKENGYHINRWPRRYYNSKAYALSRNCYPGLSKNPRKKSETFQHETLLKKCATNSRSGCDLEANNAPKGNRDVSQSKLLYNNPCEKPTALSWFEDMLSPGSSVESINSIEPFYLVPQSEPLFFPQKSDNEIDNSHKNEIPSFNQSNFQSLDTVEKPKTSTSFSRNIEDERQQAEDALAPIVQKNVPPKKVSVNNPNRNDALITTSNKESDVLAEVKHKDLEREPWKVQDCSCINSVSTISNYDVEKYAFSEYSTVSKKRASLLKWMGLFKKGSKSSFTTAPEMAISEKRTIKVKQRSISSNHSLPQPPIDIRLKQWK